MSMGLQNQKRWNIWSKLGYSQVPGVDFTDNFAPVVNDVTFRVALARMMMEDLHCMLMDVKQHSHMEKLKRKYIWRYQWE